MPPNLDIYGLTDDRSMDAVWRFASLYVAREEFERPWGVSLIHDNVPGADLKAPDLRSALQTGLNDTACRFSLYLKTKNPNKIYGAIISFTQDGKLILGLSVDVAEGGDAQLKQAERLLGELRSEHGCRLGFVMCEEPPPADEVKFREAIKQAAGGKEPLPVFSLTGPDE